MVSLAALWLPIVLAAIVVFLVSSVLHMFPRYHYEDLRKAPQEDAVLTALRGLNLPPGDYALPKCDSMQQMRSPEYRALAQRGPRALLTIAPPGTAMGTSLVQWFIYLLVVDVLCAYISGRELAPGANYLAVFRIVGFTAFVAYALALPQASIWYQRSWRLTVAAMIDGLVFGLLTAGIFGWLWPR
jgi:hypothetical protein